MPSPSLADDAALLGGIVQLAADGIISVDADERIRLFNAGAEAIFGYSAAEVMGKPLALLIPDRFRDAHRAEHLPFFARAHETARRMGERREVYGLRKSGEEFPAEVAISKVVVGGALMYNAVVRDTTERHRYETALRERSDALERLLDVARRATRAREEVLGIVAHDLRNPVGAVRMCASALAGEAADDPARVRELAGVVTESAALLDRIIADLLDASAIEAGRLSVHREPVPVDAVLATAFEQGEPAAEGRGVRLDVRSTAGAALLDADPARVQQALGNLLDNAFRFTPAGGRVTLAAVPDAPGVVRLEVVDTGAGIAAEHLPHVFDRFWQARTTRRGGAGLGLAIVKGIAEAHGGSAGVESVEGSGSRFWFTVPLTAEGASGNP